MQNLLKNWKTTSAGLALIIGNVVHLVFSVKSHTGDENTWTVGLIAIITGVGLIFAGDASASAPVTTPPPADTSASVTGNATKLGLMLLLVGVAGLVGCKLSQQQVSYNTIASLESVTTAAYDGYSQYVISTLNTPAPATNAVPQVSKAFNDFQAAELIALDAVQNNTNALAPASLVTESEDVINLINSVKSTIKK